MSKFTGAEVEAEINHFMASFGSDLRTIPSPVEIIKISIFLPFYAFLCTSVSLIMSFLGVFKNKMSISSFYSGLLSDGWALFVPTAVVSIFCFFIVYSKATAYLTIPEKTRRESKLVCHFSSLIKKVIAFFMVLMLVAAFLSFFNTVFSYLISALLFISLVSVALVINSEMSRLGTGFIFRKISGAVNNI